MSVGVCVSATVENNILSEKIFKNFNISTMPVPSPRRFSTASGIGTSTALSGSYRSTSSLDRPFYSSATGSYVNSRSSYLSRNLDSRAFDSKRVFSRNTSISEDSGISSRSYSRSDRSESRETSIRRGGATDSISITGRRLSSISVANSVDDIRQKYSPSNYVPKIHKPDIGKPPVESNSTRTAAIIRKNKDLTTSPRLSRSTITAASSNGSTSTLNDLPSLGRATLDKLNGPQNYKNLGLNGLRNIGNTCFMNSVIQCLSNTRYLLEYLRDNTYLNDINTSTSSMKGALVKAFATVIQELWSTETDKIVNTTALKSQIQRFAPRFMGYAQQDAQEFLRFFLEGLHEDVNRITVRPTPILTEIDEKLSDSQKANEAWSRYLRIDNSAIVDYFVGQLKSTLRCSVCNYCSVTFDPFWDLSLPVASSLTQCLENFTKEETLDGPEKPTCSKCQQRRKCFKSFSIQKFPKILVLHLKRFSPTERFRGKLTTLIDFPLTGLDLSSFAANSGQPSVYNLYAISNHSGTTYSGHYTAYCKHPYSGEWHQYNDSRVSSITARNVVSSEAYVLFYELAGHSSHL